MVSNKELQAANALINDATAPRVAVFAGGTSGVGKLTVQALVATGASMRIYLIGRRSSEERTKGFIQELHAVNPKAEVVWTEAEISLLADTKRVCEEIKSKEARVDLLFLTAGYAPFDGRVDTAEGLDVVSVLEHYSRMLLIFALLPVLEKAEHPRVVSVLSAGFETTWLKLDDIDLRQPGNYGLVRAQLQGRTMHTVVLDQVAEDHPHVTFIHSSPGWVNTGNVRRGLQSNSLKAWLIRLILEPLIAIFSMRDDVSAQRNLYNCTSAAFGGRGVPWSGKPGVTTHLEQSGGLFLVGYKCDSTPNVKVLSKLRQTARGKMCEHTQKVVRPYL